MAVALIGCSKDEPFEPTPPALCVSSPGWFVGGRGGISPVVTVTDCGGGTLAWTAGTEADWLSLTRSAGEAPGSFQVIAAQNRTELLRSQSVVVMSEGASSSPRIILVSQGPGYSSLCVSTDDVTVPPEGAASVAIEVENCGTDVPFDWSADEDADWMSLSRNAGAEPGAFSITAPPNYSALERSGTITVAAPGIDGSPKTILVRQAYALLADPRHYEVGNGPVSLAVADLDGDGDIDIAVGNALTDDICILKNRGDGTFGAPRFHVLRMAPWTILCVDIDGDRKKDIVVRNSSYAGITILRNLGDGTYDMPVDAPVGVYPVSLSAADIDADGDDDIAIVDAMRPVITLLTGRGDGSFSEPGIIDLSGINGVPMGVCFLDVDRDYDQDIVAAAEFPGGCALAVIKNRGNGAFEDPLFNSSMYLTYTCSMPASDFDGDGDKDIAVVNGLGCGFQYLGERLILFKNRRGGVFDEVISSWRVGWATTSLSAADIDLDGDVDLLLSSQGNCENVCVMRNDGSGSFGAPVYFTAGLDPSAIACADLDADGDTDVVVANTGSYDGVYTITVFRNFTRASPRVVDEGPSGNAAVSFAE